jgi:hypothetical protein
VTPNECVHAEPRQRLAAAVEEDMFSDATFANDGHQLFDRPRPQRTLAQLVALAADDDERRIPTWRRPKSQVTNDDVRHLVGAGADVVQEQQDGVIAAALGFRHVWRCQEGIHLLLPQVGHRWSGRSLEGDGSDLAAPTDVFRAVLCDEVGERVDGRQALIACRYAAATFLLQLLQEAPNVIGRQLLDRETVDRLLGASSDEW